MDRKKNKETKTRLEEFFERRDPSDDFEKEALEGFDAFDKDEMIEAQSELDARFSAQHRPAQQKESRRNYWMAAAALLIISGFSGYYLLQHARPLNEVAIQQPARHTPPQTPEEKTVETEPARSDQTQTLTRKETNYSKTPAPAKTTLRVEAKKEQAPETVETDAAGAASAMAYEAPAAEQPVPVVHATESKSAPVYTQKAREESEEITAKDDSDTRSRKKQFSKANTAPAMASAPAEKLSVSNSAYYKKGEKLLYVVIAEKLSNKDLLHRFDARLYINQNGVVDSMAFLKTYKLSADEQRKIKTELKGLDGFVFSNTQGQNVPAEYVINFNP